MTRLEEIEVAPARSTDIERVVTIHASAFPDARGPAERRTNFVDNPRGPMSDLFLAREGGEVVGHAFLFSMRTWVDGAPVQVGGVASVGVAPEARGRGVGRALVRFLLEESSRRGDAIQLLHPFAYAYYASVGFGHTTPLLRLRASCAALPFADEARICRRAGADDRAAILAGYREAAKHGCGMLDRSEALMNRLLSLGGATTFYVPGTQGDARGHVVFNVVDSATRGGAPGELEIDVRELVAVDPEARRALIGLLAAQRAQMRAVELTLDHGDPLPLLLSEAAAPGMEPVPKHHHPMGRVAAGPMVRVVDLQRLLTSRGWLGEGALDIVMQDALRGDVVLHLAVSGGVARVAAPAGGARLSADVATMSAIVMGCLRPSAAVAARRATLEGDGRAADALFATRAVFRCSDEF